MPHALTNHPGPGRRAAQWTATILALLLWAYVAAGTLQSVPIRELVGASSRGHQISGRVDPNVAPWWQLSHLPGIGETRARQIVDYRDRVRSNRGSDASVVFHSPADLAKVHGIGVQTAKRFASLLDLPGG